MTWLKLKFAIGVGAVALLVGAATVALSSGSVRDVKAQSYFLKGNLTYKVHTISAGEKEHPVLNSEFAVFVKGCTWKIRSWSVDNPHIEYQQTSFDGTNLYYTTKLAFGALVMDPSTNRLLKNDFFGIFYSKNPMILRVIFQKHGFFNSLLSKW